MSDEIQPFTPAGDTPPNFHVRSVVIQPRTALGKFAFAAVLVGAGVLFLTVGLALALSLAAVAVVTGVAVVGYRAITGSRERATRAAARWRRAPRSVQGDLPAQAGRSRVDTTAR